MSKIYIFLRISVPLLLFSSNINALRRDGICSWVYHRHSTCLSKDYPCSNGKCIKRELYCNGRDDCGDNSDESTCNNNYYMFGGEQCRGRSTMKKCPDSGKCIPYEWFCDGLSDCEYGEDETSCDLRDGRETVLKRRALKWLDMQKKSEPVTEMWGSLVDKTAVAAYLSNDLWTTRANETRREMAYELSIQLLARLSKKSLKGIPSNDLASYVNAFLVTCVNPRKFHGLDIIQELRTRVDSKNYTNPYLLLSLCNAGDTISEFDKIKLIDAFWDKHRPIWTDIQALVVMALACAKKQPGNDVDPEILSELTLELKRQQYTNGSFANLQTAALVMQALLSAEPDSDPKNFDENQALQQIFSMQKSDGSFGDLLDTYYVLPVLNCKSLVNISSDHCESSQEDEISALDDLANRRRPKIQVRYSLWFGNDKYLETNMALRVPVNISFFGIMEMAADIDSQYRFEYVVKNNKPYVSALSGLKDNPEKGKFWFMFTVEDGKPSLSECSPADVIPKDKEYFVMWYRSGSWVD